MHESIYACVCDCQHYMDEGQLAQYPTSLNLTVGQWRLEGQQTLPKSSVVLIEGKTNNVTLGFLSGSRQPKVLIYQTFRQLTAAFISGNGLHSVCVCVLYV